jgi:hypothetical protein
MELLSPSLIFLPLTVPYQYLYTRRLININGIDNKLSTKTWYRKHGPALPCTSQISYKTLSQVCLVRDTALVTKQTRSSGKT